VPEMAHQQRWSIIATSDLRETVLPMPEYDGSEQGKLLSSLSENAQWHTWYNRRTHGCISSLHPIPVLLQS
jgi:hypothetical protein